MFLPPSSASVVVYDKYGKDVPPHPGAGWTRFVCISDTHSREYPVPDGDVLLHSGDLSSWGSLEQLEVTVQWLRRLPHPVKVVIAGNHDLCLDRNWLDSDVEWRDHDHSPVPTADVETARALMTGILARNAGIRYIEHESIEHVSAMGKRWRIYGSPAAPRYAPGSFQYRKAEEARAIYERVPLDTEILLTHTPPHQTLDRARRGVHAGCEHLAETLKGLKDCRLHVFGHIHEAHGALVDEGAPKPGRVSVNASMPHGGQAIIVDLKDFP